jgi:hypothetical protein
LSNSQAQIRKHVFDVIEEQDSGNKAAENDKVALIRHTPTDQLTLQLVREFLDFYELDYTASVFHSEARVVRVEDHALLLVESVCLTRVPACRNCQFVLSISPIHYVCVCV